MYFFPCAGKAYLFPRKIVLGMDRSKLLVLSVVFLLAVFTLAGTASAYKASTGSDTTTDDDDTNSETCDGHDNDGDGVVDEGCGGNSEQCGDGIDNDGDGSVDEGCSNPPGAGSCFDGSDNDNHGGADDADSKACVQPYNMDYIEGMIWDSDLTNFLSGEDNFFGGFTEMGGDRDSDSASASSVTEQYVQDYASESDNYWGYGKRDSTSRSGFPSGTVDGGNRIIDPPNPDGSVTCGDGNEQEPKPDDAHGDPTSATTGCREDLGRLGEVYDVRDSDSNDASNYLKDGMTCRDDEASCETTEKSCSCSPSSCSGESCSDGSCSGTVTVECTVDSDYSEDEQNDYWYTSGDWLYQEGCNPYNGPVAQKSDSTYCSTGGCSTSWTYSCGPSNEQSCPDSCDGAGDTANPSDSDSAGVKRRWEQVGSIDCNTNNVVDGGGDERSIMGNDPAGTFTDFTSEADNGHDRVWCAYESTLTVDADGPRGYGDGFVVIENGNIVATMSPDGSDNVGQRVYSNGGFSDYQGRIDTSCNGRKVCLKYVDFYTQAGSGTRGSPEWTSTGGAVQTQSQVFTADQSYSVCKTINYINEMHGDGNEVIDCDYERSGDVAPLPEACGDDYNEHLILMEGTEVENSVTDNYLAHEQKCVDWSSDTGGFGESLTRSACVNKGTAYAEGTVLQAARNGVSGYEKSSDSTDWEVCLDIDGQGDSKRWDNTDNNGGSTDYGGEWYDLDSNAVNDYLRGAGNSLVTGGDSGDTHDVAYYWQTNQNPFHASYNPEGDNSGLALEDDCGPNVQGCDDESTTLNGKTPVFYTFFTEGMRDEDYHPQGTDSSPSTFSSLYYGYINKIQDYSDQLEPGMGTTAYGLSSSGADPDSLAGQTDVSSSSDAKWHDSMGGVDRADQFAITESLEWAISNRGIPYQPGDVYYQNDYTGFTRSKPSDQSVSKTTRVFGNSFAAVAATSLTGESGTSIDAGDGIWIDPDDMKTLTENGQIEGDWRGLMTYRIDLTGPDSGLGLNTGDNDGINYLDPGRYYMVHGNIYFEGEADGADNDGDGSKDEDYGTASTVGESKPLLEPPMCGDDRKEFLMEELGESKRSLKLDGAYACADSRNVCVDMSASGSKIFSTGDKRQTDEIDENVGRLKNDKEICQQLTSSEKVGQSTDDDVPLWYDQDYTENLCQNQNNLYGLAGIRWVPSSEIQNHPHAFTGGIDDDWNERFQQMWEKGAITKNYTSRPNLASWNFNRESPVPTGSINQSNDEKNTSIATLGFCGGDDEGEYLITQRCNTQYCETDNSVRGVADNPNNCILDGAKYPEVSSNRRDLYEPGDKVDFTFSGDSKTISCYDGVWYGDWPVVFNRDQVNVVSGQTRYVTFKIINVEDRQVTYDVELSPGSGINDAWVKFPENGTSFSTTLPAQSSKEFNVEIYGGSTSVDSANVEVIANSKDGDISGFDSVTVDIVPGPGSTSGPQGQSRNVPGIGFLQVVVMMLLAGTVYFFTV